MTFFSFTVSKLSANTGRFSRVSPASVLTCSGSRADGANGCSIGNCRSTALPSGDAPTVCA